jgi:glycosidase
MIRGIRRAVVWVLLALTTCLCLPRPSTAADTPSWPAASVIYCIYPSIFSAKGDFAGVTAQLGRLKTLGVTVVWLMPVTPIGQAASGHPAFGSPYCVHDYFAVNPVYGSEADLRTLVSTAHKLGLKVILDEVLNHTSWDNPLVTQHPEYYVHSDGNPRNPASIRQAFNYGDVAQLNYADPGLRTYMIGMLRFWIKTYGVDGFRFDTASSPNGPGRLIPTDFWLEMGRQLRETKPDLLLLGECEDPTLAPKSFALDYGWWMHDTLKAVFAGGDAHLIEGTWRHQADDFPPGTQHMSVLDDWDYPRDVQTFGGPEGAMAAAVFSFTETGIPLLYNGMEIGNAAGGVNPHVPIDWAGGDPRFPEFYRQLIALRRKNPALQQGTMTWLPSSMPSQVLTYERSGGGSQFLIEINLSSNEAQGTVQTPVGSGWTQITLAGAPGGTSVTAPQIALQPKGFAIFRRPVKSP